MTNSCRGGLIRVIWSRFFVGFFGGVVVGLVGDRAGFLLDMFPVTGIDGMGQDFHLVKGFWFTLLSHYVFDAVRQTTIVAVTENGVIPSRLSG